MVFAIPYVDLEPRRLPWVTWGLIAVWLGAALALPDAAGERLGLNPQAPSVEGFAVHWLLHATWAHALASVVLLLCVGSVLEEDWGHAAFGGFLAAAALLSSAVYLVTASGSPRPLVGASGAVAAAIGACVVRHFSDGIRYTFVGWWQRPVHREQWVPAWAIAGPWFLGEVAMQLAASGAGPTRGIHYAAQISGAALGVAIAFAMKRYDVERLWLGRMPATTGAAAGPHPALEAAREARESIGPSAALELLEAAARERPQDGALLTAFCDAARETGEPERAARPLETYLRGQLQRGEAEAAAKLWMVGTRGVPLPLLEGRAGVLLGEALRKRGERLEAARVLNAALEAPRGMTPGLALRVVELARDLHAEVALRALRLALDTPALDATKRARLETLASELQTRVDLGDAADLARSEEPRRIERPDASGDRSIEIDPDDDLRAPPPGLALASEPTATAPRVRSLGIDGHWVESEEEPEELSAADPAFEPAPALPDTLPILARATPVAPPAAPEPRGLGTRTLPPPPAPERTREPLVEAVVEAVVDGPRFSEAKRIEAVPVAWQEGRLQLRQGDEAPGWLDLRRVEAVAAAAVRGLGAKPVIVVDLLLNWSELRDEPLRVIRMRSDRFDPARLLPGEATGLEAFRGWLAAMLAASGATPLPDSKCAHGRPFRMFDDLESYEREVLSVAG